MQRSIDAQENTPIFHSVDDVVGFVRGWLERVRGRLGWLSLSYEDWDGDLFAIGAQLEYSVSKRFVIGVGYTNEDLDVAHEDSTGREKYELDMKGPTLFLGTRF